MLAVLYTATLVASFSDTSQAALYHVPSQLLGAAFPKPRDLSNSNAFQKGIQAFDAALAKGISTNSYPGYGAAPFANTTFSVGIFNTYQDTLLHEFHHTAPDVANGTIGARKADANSIYRIGSISKLFTVYIYLIQQQGFAQFEEPVTKYVPELATVSKNLTGENGVLTDWSSVTIRDLAGHLSGATANYGQSDLPLKGAPVLPESEMFNCDQAEKLCTNDEYLSGFLKLPAIFPPGYTPAYNNVAFFLLQLALQNMTGRSLEAMFQESLVEAMGLNGTTYGTPNSTGRGIIPQVTNKTTTLAGWVADIGAVSPAGNYFSTTNDMAKLGRTILNSTFLSPSVTRRWMKPSTFTSAGQYGIVGVGEPWEIYRIRRGAAVIDVYTKSGDESNYHGYYGFLPDYGVGFSILTADIPDHLSIKYHVGARDLIADILGETLIPMLDDAAREEAAARFAGTYTSGNDSITFTTDENPGIRVMHLQIGGVEQTTQYIPGPPPYSYPAPVQHADLRLAPNELYSDGEHVGFTGSWNPLPGFIDTGIGSLSGATWIGAGSPTYAGVGIGNFVFKVDSTGKAIQVDAMAFRMTLQRK